MNKTCSKCNQEKPSSDFYTRSDRKKETHAYCKVCFNSYCMERWLATKLKAIEYKGGKCVDCNKKFEQYLYDFHHLDRETKDVSWDRLRLRSWEKIKIELDKCVLLCCMCHRIREHKLVVPASGPSGNKPL